MAEATVVSYDTLNNIVYVGTQDNGSISQTTSSMLNEVDDDNNGVVDDPGEVPESSREWVTLDGADGIAADGGVTSSLLGDSSVRYYMNNGGYAWLYRVEPNALVGGGPTVVPLTAAGNNAIRSGLHNLDNPSVPMNDASFPSVVVNETDPYKLLLGHVRLYESDPNGGRDDIRDLCSLPAASGICAAPVSGGDKFDVFYYGGDGQAYVAYDGEIHSRTDFAATFTTGQKDNGSTNFGHIEEIVVHPDDWEVAYALVARTNALEIWRTSDGGLNWSSVSTGDVSGGKWLTLELIPQGSRLTDNGKNFPEVTCFWLQGTPESYARSSPTASIPGGLALVRNCLEPWWRTWSTMPPMMC